MAEHLIIAYKLTPSGINHYAIWVGVNGKGWLHIRNCANADMLIPHARNYKTVKGAQRTIDKNRFDAWVGSKGYWDNARAVSIDDFLANYRNPAWWNPDDLSRKVQSGNAG